MPDEQKARDSAAHMGNTIWVGRHHSEKSKEKNAIAHLGKVASPETREKMSASHMGNTATLGHRASPETRAKLSVARRAHPGSPHSFETRAKMSAMRKGRVITPEWQAKITAALWKGGPQVSGRKSKAKRRELGFVALNSWFIGSEGHHINKSDVIYLPRKLHRSVSHNQWTGRGMAEINALAGAFLTEDWT